MFASFHFVACIGRSTKFLLDATLGRIFNCQDKLKKLLGGKFSCTECWKLEPLGPIPILFIPTIYEKLIKSGDGMLMSFIQPLITDLEDIYVNGYKVVYNYPVELISDKLPNITESIECRALLSIWTRDHPAQTKIGGGWKLGGYSACRRHKIPSRWRGIPNTKKGLVEYHDSRQQYRTPPPIRTAESIVLALKVWRELPHGRKKDMIGREACMFFYFRFVEIVQMFVVFALGIYHHSVKLTYSRNIRRI